MSEKILIVDDDIDSLKLIGLMLQRHGYEVVAANNGGQALSKANGEHPDLIILDVMMPDMNGYEVCRRLRSNPETQAIPIIMFTAKTLIDDKVAGFEAGADDYLTKPTHPNELVARVKTILQRNTSQRVKDASTKGTTIGFIGAKGGVGTTTLALNVAAALKQTGENPIVTDLRLGVGSLGLMLGYGRSSGLANVLSHPVEEIQPALIEKELVSHASGLRALLSSPRPRETQINYAADSLGTVVKTLKGMGKSILFDLGSGYNSVVNRVQTEMDRLVVLVEPYPVTIAMARELITELDGSRPGRLFVVVVNRDQFSAHTPWQEVESALSQEIRAIISPAPELALQAVKAGTPMVMFQPNAIVSSQIAKLADDLNTRIKSLASGELKP